MGHCQLCFVPFVLKELSLVLKAWYLKEHMSESQLTLCLRNSYGHLDHDMEKAVFLQYTLPYPKDACLLCLIVENNAERSGQRDTFVKSLNAHAESAKKRKAEQEALLKHESQVSRTR